jgi:hypothetical protein
MSTAAKPHSLYNEPELTESVLLCDQRGRLNPSSIGWSRYPLHRCNLSGHWPRKKRWNYWCAADQNRLFSLTISNLDYAAMIFAYYLDFQTMRFHEQSVIIPFARGCAMPDTTEGDIIIKHPKMQVSFTDDHEQGGIRLQANCPDFDGATLKADILIQSPSGHGPDASASAQAPSPTPSPSPMPTPASALTLESLNVVIPWSHRRFQFTSKQNCLRASGTVELDGTTMTFNPEETYACLDFGRGIWPYASNWNWGSFSGLSQDGRLVGGNLGAGWTDGTGMTENAIWFNGRVSKLHEDVTFTYDRNDLMKPWVIRTTSTNRVDLRLEPFFERRARTNLLIIKSDMHQMIGRYYGTITDENGVSAELSGLIGWAEEHMARW